MLDKPSSHTASTHEQDQMQRHARRLRICALIVLVPVAAIGAVLSFQSLYRAAAPVFGARLAFGFPLLVDLVDSGVGGAG